MSVDIVKKFYAQVEKEKSLRDKLEKLGKGALDAVVKLASDAGFKFSIDDLRKFNAMGRELSDADLDAVAGGKQNTSCMAVSLL